MSWFSRSKKEETKELPGLPALPTLPRISNLNMQNSGSEKSNLPPMKIKNELPPLPSFPNSNAGEKISNEAVKHAVRESFEPEMSRPLTREIEDHEDFCVMPPAMRSSKPLVMARELPSKSSMFKDGFREKPIKNEPVYIRIDKYQDSAASFQEIKKMLLEIENLLKDVKEIKAKEEFQVEMWEKEIQEAKSKLDSIDKTIFQRLE